MGKGLKSDLVKITIGEVISHLNLKPERAKLLISPPGVGKTTIVYDWGRMLGRMVYDIPLAHFEPEDIKGIPYVNPDTKQLEFKKGDLIPSEDEKAVVFFDEVTCVSSQKIAILLKAVLEKRIGHFRFPNAYVVAAGNPPEWGGFELDSRVLSRFTVFEIEPDVDDFTQYIIRKYPNNKAVEKVVAFLHFDHSFLLKGDGSSGRLFPCPRQWEAIIDYCEDGNMRPAIVIGNIGSAAGHQFLNYLKVAENLKVVDDILNIKVPLPEGMNIPLDKFDIPYAITSALGFRVGLNNVAQMKRAIRFIKERLMKSMPKDLLLLFARILSWRGADLQPIISDLGDVVNAILHIA